MPTITARLDDLQHLMGETLAAAELAKRLPLAKAELKRDEEGELTIEFNDTNRPDLWSAEGLARQLRAHTEGGPQAYPCFVVPAQPAVELGGTIEVSPGLREIRPYIAGFVVKGITITDEGLKQFIQSQEKLSENFGNKRSAVSIGIYDAARIAWPVRYCDADPQTAAFVPLGFDEPMTLREILERHPKGIDYRYTLEGQPRYPLLIDAKDEVLSFPPIINSRALGEVKVGDDHLLVEVTGSEMHQVILACNILAANAVDRGGTIHPVRCAHPYDTPFGRDVVTPFDFQDTVAVEAADVAAMLGQEVPVEALRRGLAAYGLGVEARDGRLVVRLPPYRRDYMHPVDAIEDYAISAGYNTFEPEMPAEYTVGEQSAIEGLADQVRDLMVGQGFAEIMTNVLTAKPDSTTRVGLPEGRVVEIDNVMSELYAVLRNSLVPSLLRMESISSRATYPHRVFELGEVQVYDEGADLKSRTEVRLGALIAHSAASFSEAHSCLDGLLYYLDRKYELAPVAHGTFIPGRAGEIRIGGRPAGFIGEAHPAVLEEWGIAMPCALFEVVVDVLGEG
ncbi:MAG: phenylalanine--tRNA ligase subunit beta [Armatimonadetes bacterium]|nr:phenylalanine--tRNA ligase subunit beta [Armatimonadota bacterium]